MKADITELLIFFDELMSHTDEEKGIYWFKTNRADGFEITLVLSIYENHVGVIVRMLNQSIASLSLENCSEVRILDQERKCLEVLHEEKNGRCFLSLLEGTILTYEEQ